MLVVLAIVFVLYLLFVIVLYAGFTRAVKPVIPDAGERFITVIVPARNEEQHIRHVLHDLARQQYNNFEIIVVDDHSDDGTAAEVALARSPKIKCIKNEGSGKKHAITSAVSVSRGSVIATTDADCSVPLGWLASINRSFADGRPQMVIGAVAMEGAETTFSHMQQLEFAALIGSAAACCANGFPVMCNGANLAFTREAFVSVGGFNGNFHIASGDDEFLMRKIAERNRQEIRFMADPQSVIRTKPASSWAAFFQQRLRWAGKWKSNGSWTARLLAVFILIVQLATIVSLYRLVFFQEIFQAAFLVSRLAADALLVSRFCKFLRIQFHRLAFVLLFAVYPFYVVYTGIIAQFTTYEWKGRRY
ncbi:MAG TPA: glycosyltransferase [Chryseosolibacter sp.]|nr:glycosyltransferase [Chryseosolibacter sp.]